LFGTLPRRSPSTNSALGTAPQTVADAAQRASGLSGDLIEHHQWTVAGAAR
jgi:hypothetical protein